MGIRDNTIEKFKSFLKQLIFKPFNVPIFYLAGNRRLSLLHARLRNTCSNLNYDLFLNHLRLDSKFESMWARKGRRRTLFYAMFQL